MRNSPGLSSPRFREFEVVKIFIKLICFFTILRYQAEKKGFIRYEQDQEGT